MTHARQTVTHVPVDRLRAHPANIREDLGDLEEMARSILEHGILQPLTATEDPEHDGQLLLLAGHRRLGAATLAKLDTVPVIIRHGLTDRSEHLVVMLVENTMRRDLNPIERAEAYGALRNQGLTQSEIARRTGCHVSTVSYYLNLLMLDPYERELVRTGELASTEAVDEVRERRQEARVEAGIPLRGRPRSNNPNWFSANHRLAATVKAACTHPGRATVASSGCGPCWETAIRADAQANVEAAAAAYDEHLGVHYSYDEAVVERRMAGDRTVRTRKPDVLEIVRRIHAAGMTDGEGEVATGISKDIILRHRTTLGLEPNGNGQHTSDALGAAS